MNFTKWVQLLSSFVLILLPAAIHYRNLKHYDRRTNLHKSITVALLTLWLLSAFGIAWALYKDFSRKEKAPAFVFYLNGLPLEKDVCVTFPITNDVQHLVFAVRNAGDWPADGCQLSIALPRGVNVVSSQGWEKGGALESWEPSLKSADDNVFHHETGRALGTNFFLFFPPLTINVNHFQSLVMAQSVTAEAKNVQTVRFKYSVHFTNGIGSPHIGF